MTSGEHASFGGPITGLAAVLLVLVSGMALDPTAARFHDAYPVVFEETVEGGGAWAVAIESDETLTGPEGNVVVLRVQTNHPRTHSVSSTGMYKLPPPDGAGFSYWGSGVVASSLAGSDRVMVHPLGDHGDPSGVDENFTVLPPREGAATLLASEQFLQPGEQRYAVLWAGGGETTTFQVRGQGIEVKTLIKGDAHVLGNDELLNNGTRVWAAQDPPPGAGSGTLGAGASVVENASTTIDAEDPLVGAYIGYKGKYACPGVCVNYGHPLNNQAETALEGGLSDISYVDPEQGVVGDREGSPFDAFFLDPGDSEAGTYQFRVDRFRDAGTSWYSAPLNDYAGSWHVRTGENHLVLSVAEIDLSGLACPWPERACGTPGANSGDGPSAAGASQTEAPDAVVGQQPSTCQQHAPIRIVGDEGPRGLISGRTPTGEPIYRPGSGVVSGNGTAEDPFVIAGWCIQSPSSRGVRVATPRINIITQVGNATIPPQEAKVQAPAGIDVRDTTAHLVIERNVVDGERVGANGIVATGVENVTIHANTIRDHQWDGIEVTGSEGSAIEDNVVTGNQHGIVVRGSSDIVVQDNAVDDHPSDGIAVRASDKITVEENEVSRAWLRGIEIVQSPGTVVAGNTVTHSGNVFSLWVKESPGTVIEQNTVRDGEYGLEVVRTADALVRDNHITNNWELAAAISLSTGVVFEDNLVDHNDEHGILVWRSQDTRVRENTLAENAYHGAYLQASSRTVFENNTVTANGDHGLFARWATDPVLANNTITANGYDGTVLLPSTNATLEGNEVAGNAIGIRVKRGQGHTIHANNIHGNPVAGLAATQDGAPPVPADMNWWGCPDGPGDPSCDDVVGSVDYTPWLEEPNPQAGAE